MVAISLSIMTITCIMITTNAVITDTIASASINAIIRSIFV